MPTVKSISDIQTEIIANVFENTTQLITGQLLQDTLRNLAVSYINRITDKVYLNLQDFSTVRAYDVGEATIYSGQIYKCTTAHSAGVWNAANFTLITSGFLNNTTVNFIPLSDGTDIVDSYLSQDASSVLVDTGKNILFTGGYGIDVVATGGSDVLYIGATNANVINYGNSSTTHNFLGTAIYELQVNSYVTDKLITLNYGGAVASGGSTGFEIEENGVITGYFKTKSSRSAWRLLAPAIAYYAELSLDILTADRSYLFPDASGTLALTSNLTAYLTTATAASTYQPILSGTGLVNSAAGTISYFTKTGTGTVVALQTSPDFITGTTITLTDTGTSAATTMETITHNSSGSIVANFGYSKLIQLQSTTTAARTAGKESWYWTTATDASRQSGYALQLVGNASVGTLQDVFRVVANGNSFQYDFVNHTGYDPKLNLYSGSTVKASWQTSGNDMYFSTQTAAAVMHFRPGSFTEFMNLSTTGMYVGGSAAAAAGLHVVKATEQIRAGYDSNYYWNATTNSVGLTTFSAGSTGGAQAFKFSKIVGIGIDPEVSLTIKAASNGDGIKLYNQSTGFITIRDAGTDDVAITGISTDSARAFSFNTVLGNSYMKLGTFTFGSSTNMGYGVGIKAIYSGDGLKVANQSTGFVTIRDAGTDDVAIDGYSSDATRAFYFNTIANTSYLNVGNFTIGSSTTLGAILGVNGYQRNIGNLQVESGTIKTYASAYGSGVIQKVLYRKTTDASTTELTTDGAAGSGSANRVPVPLSRAMSCIVNIVVKEASSNNSYQMLRQLVITNDSGTTAIQGSVLTIGIDNGTAALATVSCTITANDTDDCIKIEVNGVVGKNLEFSAYIQSSETAVES